MRLASHGLDAATYRLALAPFTMLSRPPPKTGINTVLALRVVPAGGDDNKALEGDMMSTKSKFIAESLFGISDDGDDDDGDDDDDRRYSSMHRHRHGMHDYNLKDHLAKCSGNGWQLRKFSTLLQRGSVQVIGLV